MVLVGIISQVSTEVPHLVREDGYNAIVSVDLMGEIISVDDDPTHAHFSRGVFSIREISGSISGRNLTAEGVSWASARLSSRGEASNP